MYGLSPIGGNRVSPNNSIGAARRTFRDPVHRLSRPAQVMDQEQCVTTILPEVGQDLVVSWAEKLKVPVRRQDTFCGWRSFVSSNAPGIGRLDLSFDIRRVVAINRVEDHGKIQFEGSALENPRSGRRSTAWVCARHCDPPDARYPPSRSRPHNK